MGLTYTGYKTVLKGDDVPYVGIQPKLMLASDQCTSAPPGQLHVPSMLILENVLSVTSYFGYDNLEIFGLLGYQFLILCGRVQAVV